MNRATLLATSALCLLTAPAIADGAGGKMVSGLGDVGYNYLDFDADTGGDANIDNFHGSGSALWTWPSKLNVQGDFAFDSFHFEDIAGISHWRLGGGVFWRDANEGMIGGQVHYESIDGGEFADGASITGRGELFLPQTTLGAHVGYTGFDGSFGDVDGWRLGAYGTHYLQPNLGLRLAGAYQTFDDDTSNDIDEWSIDGEVEYLIPDCTTSLYAGLGYRSLDDNGSNDADAWQLGLGLRVHLGTEGSLLKRNREEPLRTIRSTFTF